jgi:predicted CXXCH cytochrome family protein
MGGRSDARQCDEMRLSGKRKAAAELLFSRPAQKNYSDCRSHAPVPPDTHFSEGHSPANGFATSRAESLKPLMTLNFQQLADVSLTAKRGIISPSAAAESSHRVAPWRIRLDSEPRWLQQVGRMTASRQARSGLWLNTGAVFLLLTGGVLVLWLADRLPFQPKRPGDRSSALREDGPGLQRTEARDALRAGRFDAAFAHHQGLPDDKWEAEDCYLLATALLERGHTVLGQAALEAARRIDPRHLAATRALDEFRGKLTLASGRDRSALHEAARRVELLRFIPGGPALGMLTLGLAGYAGDSDQEDEFLDRLGVRDRSLLRSVNGTGGATKLIARLLLETGRATEARDLLDSLVAKSRATANSPAGSDSSLVDHEAAWLFSRAALQLGDDETADAMVALAGDFGTTLAALPEPAPFVGSRRCGDCHLGIFRAQQGASRHSQTLRFGADLKNVPLPAHPVTDPVIPSITHRFARKGDDKIEIESQVEDQVVRAVVDYAVGSGRHGITMLGRDTAGIERELRISYFGEGATWGETKGVDFAPRDAGDHLGIGMGRHAVDHCLHCHTTWFRSLDTSTTASKGPEREDKGIGCERCHGPGLNHVKAVESGFVELAIALTRKNPALERLNSCVECHAADGTIQPSDPEFTRAQGTTFLFSRCFTAAKDRFNCTTCHDPHRAVVTNASHYETVCLGCHTPRTPGIPAAQSAGHVTNKAEPESQACPVNPAGDCISCHMPTVEDPSRRSRFTDHHIRIHRGARAAHAVEPAH